MLPPMRGAASGYDVAAQAYFTAAETLDADAFDQTAVDPTQTAEVNKEQIDTVVRSLKSASLWSPLVEAWWFREVSFTALPTKLKYESDADLTLNNYISADYLSEGTDPGLQGNSSTKTETTTYTSPITGSIAVFTSNGSFYGECSIPASYTSSQYNLGRKEAVFIFNRALTTGERTALETIMVGQGARPFGLKAGVTNLTNAILFWSILTSFDDSWDTSAVTNFLRAWRGTGLVSFPPLDAGSGLNFFSAWEGCGSLTSFPLINANNATTFGQCWLFNSSLADFPSGFFDSWDPSIISSRVFDRTWEGCTSLTPTSVENILVSIDTSGKYGTDTGTSGGTVLADSAIDIDYDGSGLSAATTTAITNLKIKNWQVNINGVLQ